MYKPLAECPEKPGYGFHIVQPGESLNAIARTYGVSIKQLIGWNKIKDADHIEPCQKIWLIEPPKPAEPAKTSQSTPKTPQIDPGLRVVSQAPLWDLQPGQVGPPSPATYALTAKSPAETSAATTQYHTVQKGETVSSLSKKYGFSEAAFRKLNNLPAKGDVVIFPGQKLRIDDPSKPPQAATPPPAEAPATRKVTPTAPASATQNATPKSVEPEKQPAAPVLAKPVEQPKPPAAVVQPAEAVTAKPQAAPPPPVQEVFIEEAIVAPVTTTAQPVAPVLTKPVETVREPAYIQEYTVREGDSIDSVAKKYGIHSKDLAEFNAKKSDEKLVAGTRLMIPKY
jgi:LysM repeat protein